MSALTLNLDGITDPYIREELKKVQDYTNNNAVSRGSFRAFEINRPAGIYKISRGFNFVPNIFLYAGGTGPQPTIDPTKATKEYFEVSVTGSGSSIFVVGYINKREIRS